MSIEQKQVIDALSEVFMKTVVNNNQSCRTNVSSDQSMKVSLEGCEIAGDVDISQKSTQQVDMQCALEAFTSTKQKGQLASDVSAGMEQAVKQMGEANPAYDKQVQDQIMKITNRMMNEQTINSTLSAISDTSAVQFMDISCKNTKIGGNFRASQSIMNKVRNVLDLKARSEASSFADLKSKTSAKATQKSSVTGDFAASMQMLVQGAIVIAIGLALVLLVVRLTRKDSSPAAPSNMPAYPPYGPPYMPPPPGYNSPPRQPPQAPPQQPQVPQPQPTQPQPSQTQNQALMRKFIASMFKN